MITKRDVSDVISIFHDGAISGYSGDKNKLTLTIDCQYLAELIDKDFKKFFVTLTKVDKLELTTWPQNKYDSARILTQLPQVFQADLEIINVIKNEKGEEVLNCLQLDPEFDYSGGDLRIVADEIQVLDQAGKEMTIKRLLELTKEYWDSAGE